MQSVTRTFEVLICQKEQRGSFVYFEKCNEERCHSSRNKLEKPTRNKQIFKKNSLHTIANMFLTEDFYQNEN